MKVESKRFLTAITAFVTVVLITVLSSFSTYKPTDSKSVNETIVSVKNIE